MAVPASMAAGVVPLAAVAFGAGLDGVEGVAWSWNLLRLKSGPHGVRDQKVFLKRIGEEMIPLWCLEHLW